MGMSDKKLSFFDFISNINEGKRGKDLLSESSAAPRESAISQDDCERSYNTFMINRGLSQFQDCILFANEMNVHNSLPPKMQYDFYRNALRARKRFSKWAKAKNIDDDIAIIKRHYGYSTEKACAELDLFSKDALERLHKLYDTGGK
jgi:hypothetical protein